MIFMAAGWQQIGPHCRTAALACAVPVDAGPWAALAGDKRSRLAVFDIGPSLVGGVVQAIALAAEDCSRRVRSEVPGVRSAVFLVVGVQQVLHPAEPSIEGGLL